MDLGKYRNKLVGSEEERAVSPVIGVILMVAITVILAAVIAAFVLDLGDDMGNGSVNAGVSSDVSDTDRQVTISLDSTGDAEEFRLAGDIEQSLSIDQTGDQKSINLPSEGGQANIVAVSGDAESTVGSFDWEDGVRAEASAEIVDDDGDGVEDSVTVTADTIGDANSFYVDWDNGGTTDLSLSSDGDSDTVSLQGDETGSVVAVDEDPDDDIEDEIEGF